MRAVPFQKDPVFHQQMIGKKNIDITKENTIYKYSSYFNKYLHDEKRILNMNILKYTFSLILPLTASTPLFASLTDDAPSHSARHFRFETAYSAEQYARFFKTAHLYSPSYPSSCIADESQNKFFRDAFYYGIQSLSSTNSMRTVGDNSRFDIYKTAVALINMTAANNFNIAFNDRAKRGKFLHQLTGIVENILSDISNNRGISSASNLRYPLQLSRLILRVGHFQDILDTHQNRFGFDVTRQNRWMTYLWNDLNALREHSRTVVIETFMAKMILEQGYQPAGIDDPLSFADRLLLENHTHPSGTSASAAYSRRSHEIHHLTSRTNTVTKERSALRDLLRHKQEIAREISSDSSLYSSSSLSSSDISFSNDNSMDIVEPESIEPFSSSVVPSFSPSLSLPVAFMGTEPVVSTAPSLLSSSNSMDIVEQGTADPFASPRSNDAPPLEEESQGKKRSAFDIAEGKEHKSRSKERFSSRCNNKLSKEKDLLTSTLLEKIRTSSLSAASAASTPFFSSGLSSSSFASRGDDDFLIQVTLEEVRRHFLLENFDPVQAIQNYRTVFSNDSRSNEELVHTMVPYILTNYGR